MNISPVRQVSSGSFHEIDTYTIKIYFCTFLLLIRYNCFTLKLYIVLLTLLLVSEKGVVSEKRISFLLQYSTSTASKHGR